MNVSEFVKVIIRNVVSFFTSDTYSKDGTFDDVIITSALHSNK